MMNNELTERQQEIIHASLVLIEENGIQGLTIKNLASKIGFSESAVYRHYENKIQILLAILGYFEENTGQFYAGQLESGTNSLLKIENIFRNHFRKFTDNPSLVSVIFSEEIFRNEKELTEKVREIMEKYSSGLITIIESGQKNGVIRRDVEASLLAVLVIGALRLFVKKWHMSDYSFDLVQNGEKLIDMIKLIITEKS
ncbi:MAG: TetR/AcrR family transcriptional regulator [Bacteroidales bacterium]|nr:TetR/AcrR family transcriptional regulator [Bacteroidales bacterium]